MPRARSNVPRLKRKKQIMKAARGAYGGRSKLWKAAKETVERGWRYAYRDRKNRKRDFRRLWIARISAACDECGIKYSELIHGLTTSGIQVNRKMLSELAIADMDAFRAVVAQARAAV